MQNNAIEDNNKNQIYWPNNNYGTNSSNSFYASSILNASELLLKLPQIFLNNNNLAVVSNNNQKIYKEPFIFSDEDDDYEDEDEEDSNLCSTPTTLITPIVENPFQTHATLAIFTTQLNCAKHFHNNEVLTKNSKQTATLMKPAEYNETSSKIRLKVSNIQSNSSLETSNSDQSTSKELLSVSQFQHKLEDINRKYLKQDNLIFSKNNFSSSRLPLYVQSKDLNNEIRILPIIRL